MIDPKIKHRIALERRIVRMIVEDAIAQGHVITVFDGEEHAIKRSTDVKAILDYVMGLEEAVLIFRTATKNERVGDVVLVFGNDGHDVISDSSWNDVTNAILKRAEHYAAHAEEVMA